MSPRFSRYDLTNHGLRDVVLLCQLMLINAPCRISPSNRTNNFRRKLSVAVRLAAWHPFNVQPRTVKIALSQVTVHAGRMFCAFRLPTLRALVEHVLSRRSQKQMGRITARWVIALMQYLHPQRLDIGTQEKRDTVSSELNELKRYDAVTILIRPFQPGPTLIRVASINARPKSFDFLPGKVGEFSIAVIHDLKVPFRLWLGSFAVQPAFGPLVF
jgi:hypothetical protein